MRNERRVLRVNHGLNRNFSHRTFGGRFSCSRSISEPYSFINWFGIILCNWKLSDFNFFHLNISVILIELLWLHLSRLHLFCRVGLPGHCLLRLAHMENNKVRLASFQGLNPFTPLAKIIIHINSVSCLRHSLAGHQPCLGCRIRLLGLSKHPVELSWWHNHLHLVNRVW